MLPEGCSFEPLVAGVALNRHVVALGPEMVRNAKEAHALLNEVTFFFVLLR